MFKYIRLYIAILFVCFLFVFAGTPVFAQTFSSESDTVNVQIEPGIYFPVKKELSSSAVYSISGETIYKTPTSNLTNTLYGLIPGLMVRQTTGEPKYDGAEMYIRGMGSYNSGSYTIFVDGFQTQNDYWQFLSPTEIESISVFKDGAALAPFGMRGANGVIWIETKRGRIGKPKIQAQFRRGIQQAMNITKPLQSFDYASLYNEAVSNDNGMEWNPVYSNTQLDNYKNGRGYNTDWYSHVLKPSASFFSSDLTFDGGVRDARYFVMLGITDTKGLYDVNIDDEHSNLHLKQFNLRSNFDFSMYNIFVGKIELGGRIDERKMPAFNTSTLWSNLASYPNNIYSVRNDNGTWPGTTIYPSNPVASVKQLGYWSTHDRTMQANFSLKEKLDFMLPGLYLSQAASFSNWTRGSYNVTRNYTRWMQELDNKGNPVYDNEGNPMYQQQTTDLDSDYSIYDDNGTNQWDWKQFQAGVGYDAQLGNHSVSAVTNYLQHSYFTDSDRNGPAEIQMRYNVQNIGGRIHYEYASKYVGEIGLSYSGSDNFKKGNRFGFYPAISAAWILSKESIFENFSAINLLKIRLSAGKSAYDSFNWAWHRRYLYEQYYIDMGSYPTGNQAPSWNSGIGIEYFANPDIFAEESMKYNIGLDTRLFEGLNLTLDAFMDKRSGIISQDHTMSGLIGVTPPMRNIGKVTTKGIEADLNFSGSVNKFRYTLGGNISYLKDNIDFMAELAPASPLAARTGRPIGARFGYEFIGFYDITDFNSDGTLKEGIPVSLLGSVQPGDLKYRDLNDDSMIDESDMLVIGKRDFPETYYSFRAEANYSGFDLRILFQGMSGREVNIANSKTIAFQNNGTVYEIAKGRWAYYPDQGIDTRASATYPRLSTQMNENNYTSSTFWIKNGNFLRVRNMEIGYTLPKRFLQKLNLSNFRFFVNGVNLFTFSSLLKEYDLDPEVMMGYPAMKSYNAGITVGL